MGVLQTLKALANAGASHIDLIALFEQLFQFQLLTWLIPFNRFDLQRQLMLEHPFKAARRPRDYTLCAVHACSY